MKTGLLRYLLAGVLAGMVASYLLLQVFPPTPFTAVRLLNRIASITGSESKNRVYVTPESFRSDGVKWETNTSYAFADGSYRHSTNISDERRVVVATNGPGDLLFITNNITMTFRPTRFSNAIYYFPE